MIYQSYSIGGELVHSAKGQEWTNHKYKEKKKSKTTGKWYYVYDKDNSEDEIKRRENTIADLRLKAFKAKTTEERMKYLQEIEKYKKSEGSTKILKVLDDIDKKKKK